MRLPVETRTAGSLQSPRSRGVAIAALAVGLAILVACAGQQAPGDTGSSPRTGDATLDQPLPVATNASCDVSQSTPSELTYVARDIAGSGVVTSSNLHAVRNVDTDDVTHNLTVSLADSPQRVTGSQTSGAEPTSHQCTLLSAAVLSNNSMRSIEFDLRDQKICNTECFDCEAYVKKNYDDKFYADVGGDCFHDSQVLPRPDDRLSYDCSTYFMCQPFSTYDLALDADLIRRASSSDSDLALSLSASCAGRETSESVVLPASYLRQYLRAIDTLPQAPGLQDAFAAYLANQSHFKAFAVDHRIGTWDAAYGRSSADDAMAGALANCETCQIYALGDTVVFGVVQTTLDDVATTYSSECESQGDELPALGN